MRALFLPVLCLLTGHLLAAELAFDFGAPGGGRTPADFTGFLSGKGQPGEWKVLYEEVPSLMQAVTPGATAMANKAVLAQVSQDPTDDRYPVLMYDKEVFGDFTLTTRFKLVNGKVEQMAGVAFRIQDPKNYYYVRASALGSSFYFFKFVNGDLIGPIGSKVQIPTNTWQEITVECRGSEITCSLNGQPVIPKMRQDNFPRGKIGFWTKSDSVSYFADARIVYTPIQPPGQRLVRDVFEQYSKLLGLKIYLPGKEPGSTRIIASTDEKEIGQPGSAVEANVLKQDQIYHAKDKGYVAIIMPLRDKNGEAIAAVRVVMKPVLGQTQDNAIARATPVVKALQKRVQTLQNLVE